MKIPIDPLRLVPLVSALYKGWQKTLRFDVDGDVKAFLEKSKEGTPFIVALWHGELFPLAAYVQNVDCSFVIMVSQSKDGELISRFLERNGHITVRGSSSRGGVQALIKAKHLMLKEKYLGAITVDGPRGPRHTVKNGIFLLAQKTGAQILPVRAFANRAKRFQSWDRFVLPYPFATCQLRIGEPLEVTKEKLGKDVLKRERERLERRLFDLGKDQEGEGDA
ncbi:DUF374 domain-containing protein [Pseudodesulfovibrio sp. JC047]|uniref:lysophospholipid acyltransferase family protein n=1 Tax=Pseudodesulfovibrio sp. JC047 TaxID=2683199 RepID=UPI0013D11249|nr:lysophospholipid acyltransferase family protein [Pseudodesulfovibrio sp. JC047]NDV19116.1 DUF374 domain-containing protein [Pseudodesulfovibrio sp. JC047]